MVVNQQPVRFRLNINVKKLTRFAACILEIQYFNLYFATKLNSMSVILVLVVFSVMLAGGFLAAFFWSVRNGQYDDTYSSSVRILFDDDKPAKEDGLNFSAPSRLCGKIDGVETPDPASKLMNEQSQNQ